MILLILLPPAAHAGSAATIVEANGQDKFSPSVAEYIVISNQFIWYWGTDGGGTTAREHEIRQDKGLFRSPGGPRTSFPGVPPGFVVSASAGTFPYYCTVHGGPGGQGMSARIRTYPVPFDTTDDEVGVKWADPSNTTGDQYDVRYRVGDGNWRDWKRNTAKLELVFGKNDKPIDVRDGKTYRFRARSEKSSNPAKHSGWSGVLKQTTTL
jgi:hypothetical protein